MNEKLRDLIRNNIGYLAVAVVCLAYIATAFIQFEENNKTVARIIADGVVAFLMGILINRIFDTQGIMNGEREAKVQKTVQLHNQIVDNISPYMDQLDDWCEMKNAEALMRGRRQYLSRYGMRYRDYFEEDGTAKEFVHKTHFANRRERKQETLRFYRFRHALNLKLTRISAGILISDSGRDDDPFSMGRSKPQYAKDSAKKDTVTKILTAFVFGYYGVSLLSDLSYANLIWTVLQTGIFLLMGVIKLQQSFLFVTDEYRGRIIRKIDVLQLFEIWIKQEENRNGTQKENAVDERRETDA